MINNFDAGLLWDEYGICTDVLIGLIFPEDEDVNQCHFKPFTHSFPHADIHAPPTWKKMSTRNY